MLNASLIPMARKLSETILLLVGSVLAAYNLLAFSVTSKGVYFFKDAHQIALGIGVSLIVLALLVRNWNKL
jgi:hypothetical protein